MANSSGVPDAMISAGIDALDEYDYGCEWRADAVVRIFTAMVRASPVADKIIQLLLETSDAE